MLGVVAARSARAVALCATALVDATEDAARAREVFLRAVARLGAGAVVMYTETMHDALEVFVRVRGSLFLLGPLFDEQWEEYLARLLGTKRVAPGRADFGAAAAAICAFARPLGKAARMVDRSCSRRP